MVLSRKTLPASEARDLEQIMNDMGDFTCGCDISGDLTEALKAKGVSMNRNMRCLFFSFSKWRKKNQRFENLGACGGLQ